MLRALTLAVIRDLLAVAIRAPLALVAIGASSTLAAAAQAPAGEAVS